MRTRVPIIIALALLCFTPQACKRASDPKHLYSLDSMMVITDSLRRAVMAIDMPGLLAIDSIYRGKRDSILDLMNDTLQKRDAIAIGNFHRAMNGSMIRVKRDHDAVNAALTSTSKQLIDLRHDVDHGLLPPEQERANIYQEGLFVTQQMHATDMLCGSAENVQRNWRMYHEHVDSLLHAPRNLSIEGMIPKTK